MKNPGMVVPEAMAPLQAIGQLSQASGMPSRAIALAQVRASQINGCSLCLDGALRSMRAAGESDDRLFAVSVWRESSRFTDAERAALALSEAMTRLSDRPDPVSDAVWNEAARHYNERELAGLVLGISVINLYNRVNVATHQVAEDWKGADDPEAAKKWAAANTGKR